MNIEFTIAICDDEEYYREHIKELIEKYFSNMKVSVNVDLFKNGKEFCENVINYHKYDVIFLDIDMEGKNGMEIAHDIRNRNRFVEIVFITIMWEYVFEGYDIKAFRYIMKKDMECVLPDCLDALLKEKRCKNQQMKFKFTDGMHKINLSEVLYIESKLHKLSFQMENGELWLYDKLDSIEKMLSDYAFVRTHQSFLVNMQHIEKISSYKLFLSNGEEMSVTKPRYKGVMEKFLRFKEI